MLSDEEIHKIVHAQNQRITILMGVFQREIQEGNAIVVLED